MINQNIKYIASLALLLLVNSFTRAQQGFGTANPNPNAVVDLSSTNKGLLLPRLALTSTTSASPLTAHTAGMSVYNTATAADVTPGFYYNDGSKWQRVDIKPTGNWNLENTSTLATGIAQNIYQMGKIGVGINNPLNALHVSALANPIKILGLKQVTDILGSNLLFVDPTVGVWKASTVNLPLAYVKKKANQQTFVFDTFNSTSNAEVLTFAAADELLIDNGLATLSGNEFTIQADGTYDIYSICNLVCTGNTGANYTTSALPFMSVILKMQKSTGGGPWVDLVSTVTATDIASGYNNVTTTLGAIMSVERLLKNDKIRFTIQRFAGAYNSSSAATINTFSNGNGVTNSKLFKLVKLN